MAIPTLSTARLRLRGHEVADFPALAAMWADPVVTRYLGGGPFGEEACWGRLLRYRGHWELLGFGYWLVEETETGRYIGEVGFADYKRENLPAIQGIPEIGWILTSDSHGKGYATEAAQAAVAWIGDRFPGARTACIIDPENRPSLRVADKCGYREFELTSYKGQPVLLLKRA